jgi:RHS repeat-associated protein
MVYDGDGNRVSETAGSTTTKYLIDSLNPTGYAQVLDELVSGAVTKTYTYGVQRISENQLVSSTWTPSFYGYDGHGNVRFLTNMAGAVGNTYQFDAFWMSITSAGTTANTYLYSGERFDQNIGLYHLRARYYNMLTGRFETMDPFSGKISDPATLHRYVYASNDPVNRIDPSGKDVGEYGELSEFPSDEEIDKALRGVEFATCVDEFVENASVQELYLGYSLAELQLLAIEYCAGHLH